ncbi:Lecithin:cholesterol/phospholipid:diacylglycerol acyltransferase [Mycena albidolilacea]|uniref:Lecithin:cholesterol/phospholipid:diacylglycerol acyltransferase n=1 Tax=Mycena albidolilacea TaxID=1033008 RepID=A0AAD7A6U4_9AGAR|nr:Lecithin:cholesterol/phospholipid:diacylglycerol acyltransferase [Mycena albidolilacea]
MLSLVTFNRDKWMSAMMLDPVTGLDPFGAKVRAAEGIDAASSFIQGYWIWAKIVENLAAVNYDTNNLYLAPYDWRLSYYNLEERDGYFSRLKTTIEGFKHRQKRKTVIAAHSMDATVRVHNL